MIPRQLLNYPEQLAKRLSDMEREMDKLKREMKYVNNSGGGGGGTPSSEVGDGALTLRRNGTAIGSFTANQDFNTTVDISVPTKTSELTNDSDYVRSTSLALVATSGSYNDLSNKPTIPVIPTNISAFTNDVGYLTSIAWNDVTSKPTFAAVATSGDYDDLSNKPTIPAAQVQADWAQYDPDAVDFIKNKPQIQPLDFYPVGSIYMSVNNTNPGTLFGGTWEQIQDKFLLAAGTTYSGGSTGGAASINLEHSHTVNSHNHSLPANTGNHTLTVDEMPSHYHAVNTCYYQIGQNTSNAKIASTTYNSYWNNNPNDGQKSIQNAGGSQAHSHPIGGNTGNATPGTNSQLSASQSILPPYLTVYVWKRTA